MRTAEISEHLSIPIRWIEPKKTKRDAMALITVTSGNSEKSVLISPRGLMQVDANNYVFAPEERKDLKKSIFAQIVKRLFQIASWSMLTCLVMFTIVLATDTTQARVVLTDSMSPTIKPGDVVISVSPKFKSPKVGDVVYRAKFKRLDAESVHITNDICDIIYGKMIDLCGETADDFEIENSKYVELDTFIKKWSEEIGINTYYTIVGDSQEYVITQQDLEK